MRFVICDVFTDRPLAGNQLAVFPDASGIPEHLLQPLAREINFSETVFVYPPADPAHTARIRIFVPMQEISFAGHPVLGTATVLGAERGIDDLVLETRRAPVPVRLHAGGGTMEQPLPEVEPYRHADQLLAALDLQRSAMPVDRYDNGMPHVYVRLDSVEQLAALRPDMNALTELPDAFGTGFNVFAGSGTLYTNRMFAPADGVPEDPATGSAAGPLACHLLRHGVVESGTEITISQGASVGRPSTLYATAQGAADGFSAVLVRGSAVIVAEGRFTLPGETAA
ncbi:MAG TPA: PhzF family phenazine biosynthesis protein [Gaiellales bacterium]|jgi:trans-2,3-dihydro-3-hydroxyanthranilate isomerase|nr:PhzF family phenazine biosynthesis protein [Gaiellales bacterium]